MKKIYLAGPDVFAPNSIEIGKKLKNICEENNFIGLYPLDNEIEQSSENKKIEIVKGNILSIEKCDYILANLSNFRGSKVHPSCDSGTAWECGYGLAKGKRIFAYTNEINAIPEIMINLLDLIINKDFEGSINILKSIFMKQETYLDEKIFDKERCLLDAEYEDIKDSSPEASFILGYRYGKGLPCNAIISDDRNQIEKYGERDQNGYAVENFNEAVNIMIACTCNIIKKIKI